MPKGSPELTAARREEIINACGQLYETRSFGEISLKDVAAYTSFTRPSIYNYFQTKEEIFLALLQREYGLWTEDLNALTPSGGDARRELAEGLAETLARRETLLKLLSTNLNEMEQNSRLERLVEFKVVFGGSIRAVEGCLERFCPELDAPAREEFVYSFFPLMYGVYPYAAVTEKQREAMARAGIPYRRRSVYELAYLGVKKLLGVSECSM